MDSFNGRLGNAPSVWHYMLAAMMELWAGQWLYRKSLMTQTLLVGTRCIELHSVRSFAESFNVGRGFPVGLEGNIVRV